MGDGVGVTVNDVGVEGGVDTEVVSCEVTFSGRTLLLGGIEMEASLEKGRGYIRTSFFVHCLKSPHTLQGFLLTGTDTSGVLLSLSIVDMVVE